MRIDAVDTMDTMDAVEMMDTMHQAGRLVPVSFAKLGIARHSPNATRDRSCTPNPLFVLRV